MSAVFTLTLFFFLFFYNHLPKDLIPFCTGFAQGVETGTILFFFQSIWPNEKRGGLLTGIR
jgi:F0F1-type ATP synthase membrane subunit a